jgi:hypothetical protein
LGSRRRFIEVPERAVVIALDVVRISAAVEGVHQFRIESDRLVEVPYAAVGVALVGEGQAAVVVGDSHFRINPGRFIEVLEPGPLDDPGKAGGRELGFQLAHQDKRRRLAIALDGGRVLRSSPPSAARSIKGLH